MYNIKKLFNLFSYWSSVKYYESAIKILRHRFQFIYIYNHEWYDNLVFCPFVFETSWSQNYFFKGFFLIADMMSFARLVTELQRLV